jgi:hypothetical protein
MKNSYFVFLSALFIVGVFFASPENVLAMSCNECEAMCTNASTVDNVLDISTYQNCYNSYCDAVDVCKSTYIVTQADCAPYRQVPNDTQTACVPVAGSDCSAYANTTAVDGACECNVGYSRSDNGKDCYETASVGMGYTQQTCEADKGYWAKSVSTCYQTGNAYCEDTMGVGYSMNKLGQCIGNNNAECISGSDCAYGCSCIKGVCQKGGFGDTLLGGCDNAPVDPLTAEQQAAAKAEAQKTMTDANTAAAMRNNAVANANAANAVLASCGTTCTAEQQKAAADANAALLAANAAFDEKIALANAAAAAAGSTPNSSSTGAGFMLCANGTMGTICDGGGGTPITTGLGGGGGAGFGGYVAGASGAIQPKCPTGFQDIGGVCFPGNTGLSNTPIYVIVSNIFSWLMGLFTTLAVLAFVVSGIQYFLASGDESMAKKAKENATNAIIGIIVGLSGFIVIKAIAAALAGTSMFF